MKSLARFIVSGCIVVFIVQCFSFCFNHRGIPPKWTKDMVLTYSFSGGMAGDYHVITISGFVYRYEGKERDGESKIVVINLTQAQCDDLLSVLRENKADKLFMRKLNYTVYDGYGFSLRLRKNDEEIVNLSNSANEALSEKDSKQLDKIVQAIHLLRKS